MSELAASLLPPLSALRRYATIYAGLLLLGGICLTWSLIALPAHLVLPRRSGAAFGRMGIHRGFRIYTWAIQALGGYRLDLSELGPLRQERGIILAPNHPHLIDALLLLSMHPNLVCVLKTRLMNNVFLGAGARLARFIRNDMPRRMIGESVAALKDGSALLLFPEGTRTVRVPVNQFQLATGAIAKHAQVPVQTLLIETDSPYLSKGWTLFHVPDLPINYRVRLGKRFEPPVDIRRFTQELEEYFTAELAHAPQRAWLGELQARRASLSGAP